MVLALRGAACLSHCFFCVCVCVRARACAVGYDHFFSSTCDLARAWDIMRWTLKNSEANRYNFYVCTFSLFFSFLLVAFTARGPRRGHFLCQWQKKGTVLFFLLVRSSRPVTLSRRTSKRRCAIPKLPVVIRFPSSRGTTMGEISVLYPFTARQKQGQVVYSKRMTSVEVPINTSLMP